MPKNATEYSFRDLYPEYSSVATEEKTIEKKEVQTVTVEEDNKIERVEQLNITKVLLFIVGGVVLYNVFRK